MSPENRTIPVRSVRYYAPICRSTAETGWIYRNRAYTDEEMMNPAS